MGSWIKLERGVSIPQFFFHGGINGFDQFRHGCIVAVIYNGRRPKGFSIIQGVVNMILMILLSVPCVKIGHGVQTDFPLAVQINSLRKLDVITPYFVIGIHIRGCIARLREIKMRSAHAER